MRTPFLTLPQIADDLARKALRYGTIEGHVPAEEAHDVGAAEGGDGVLQQARVQPPQLFGRAEADVDRPLALIGRPVILRWTSLEDLGVDRVQGPSNIVQQRRPLDFELLVHQLLRRRPGLDPWKTVIVDHVCPYDSIL